MMDVVPHPAIKPADGINLATALLNISSPTGAVAGYAKDLLRWLSRQGVDEKAFERCTVLARSLAYPNEHGAQIQTSVVAADERLRQLKNLPISLWHSGALGRLMLQDPEYCYMISTVATLTVHHNLEYAKDALISMLLDEGDHETDVLPKYHIQRAPVKAVMSKIVDSIYLNVTNVGHQTAPLPEIFASLHPHLLDCVNFAALVMGIQKTKSNLMLLARKFPADLMLWLLNHFEGRLKVYRHNEEIYSSSLGASKQEIKFIVQDSCTGEMSDCEKVLGKIELLELFDATKTRRLVTGKTASDEHMDPAVRHALYETSSKLDRKLSNSVFSVAEEIMFWLLNIRVGPTSNDSFQAEPYGLVFSCSWERNHSVRTTSSMSIEGLFRQLPTLVNQDSGARIGSAPVFVPAVNRDSQHYIGRTSNLRHDLQEELEGLLEHFPAVQDLTVKSLKGCLCYACQENRPFMYCKPGCQRSSAISMLCTLLCHGIADGFGAQDVSAGFTAETAITATLDVFRDLIDKEMVSWDIWFRLAMSVITGLSWESSWRRKETSIVEDMSETCLIGVQHGSLFVTAPWLGSAYELGLEQCFSVQIYDGVVEGISDETALLTTERDSRPDLDNKSGISQAEDAEPTEQHVYFRTADSYRRMVFITAGKVARMVDVVSKMRHLSLSTRPVCAHDKSADASQGQDTSMYLTFPRLLRLWGWPVWHRDMPYKTVTLNSLSKVSTALALACGGAVLRDIQQCCEECAIRYANRDFKRYIISYSIDSRLLC